MPYNANQNEQEILEFWDKEKIFERSVNERPASEPYVFYDGPPFATGLPHYGHIVASVMKDVVPRYYTMQGKRVERIWGWDCHGLPIENIVEKELGTKTKKEIQEMGVDKFNEMCRSKVLSYVADWQKTIHRLGRWVDMEHAYRTMDLPYMESVWAVFKQLWDKGLIYEDYRSMHICPRCETTLSQQEVSEGYKDVKDISVFPKFKIKNAKEKLGLDGDVYMIAWTTTPWTLPGNVALAVGGEIPYSVLQANQDMDRYSLKKGHIIILADGAINRVLNLNEGESFKPIKIQELGSTFVNLKYEPLFPYYKDTPNAFRVVAGDFVTTTDGTGIVHIAPAYGDDDFQVGKREKIPLVQHVGMDGRFKPEVTDFAGQEVKPRSDDDKVRLSSDIAVLKYLQDHNLFFAKQNIVHSYPHCWRCDTPLLNYATSSWFVNVTKIKDQALEEAKKINWSPEHIKEGRFGKWLEGARDWSISRQRFWASVMPVWICDSQKEHQKVFGSVAELEQASGQKVADLHKHVVDPITFACADCGGTMRRVPDVLDTWFDSGSMPYAQLHYPFENTEKFDAGFPAEFIAEGQDQTRAWFYYLHILGTALQGSPAFKNVIVNGIVLAEDGKKMSKKLKNYPDPMAVLEKYGADALRFYLASSPVMHAENLNFSEDGVREVYNKLVNTLANVLEFYQMFVGESMVTPVAEPTALLDRWVLGKLEVLVDEVTIHMNTYQLAEASRPIQDFVTELSQWYVRRSRDRFKGEDEADATSALATLHTVLLTLSKLLAPFAPFLAEKVYQTVAVHHFAPTQTSVHLETWPQTQFKVDEGVLLEMDQVRKLVEMGLSLRKESGIKVRQTLSTFSINVPLSEGATGIIADEINVKQVLISTEPISGALMKQDGDLRVSLDSVITPELRMEGLAREVIRAINQIRKDQGLTRHDRIAVTYETEDKTLTQAIIQFQTEIQRSVVADSLTSGRGETEVVIDHASIKLTLAKIR